MRILFSSYAFSPSIGGIESVSAILAEKFAEAGHEVELITESSGEAVTNSKYRLTRRPSFWKLLGLLSWCDLLFQNNISLRSLIPALLLRKRVIVVHQTWLRSATGKIGWNNRIKRALLSRVTNVAISHAIGDHLQVPARVIGNPYDDGIFRLLDNVVRDKTLVFLGRLVSDKGADLLLQAMKILQTDGLRPDLTIIGSGPEKENLQALAHKLGLDQQVTFAGPRSGPELAELLNRYRLIVVPSRWPEPFGIVALEGIACGGGVVGSSGGGLKDAIGPCGITFENGSEHALAVGLKNLLLDQGSHSNLTKQADAHLATFRGHAVASAYLELIQEITK
jgi:glycosyltransferase involved in cell wall biosynthesis